MTLDVCHVPGCTARAPWGQGSVLRGTHISACTAHRSRIWPDAASPSLPDQPEGLAAIALRASPSPVSEQGSLFG